MRGLSMYNERKSGREGWSRMKKVFNLIRRRGIVGGTLKNIIRNCSKSESK